MSSQSSPNGEVRGDPHHRHPYTPKYSCTNRHTHTVCKEEGPLLELGTQPPTQSLHRKKHPGEQGTPPQVSGLQWSLRTEKGGSLWTPSRPCGAPSSMPPQSSPRHPELRCWERPAAPNPALPGSLCPSVLGSGSPDRGPCDGRQAGQSPTPGTKLVPCIPPGEKGTAARDCGFQVRPFPDHGVRSSPCGPPVLGPLEGGLRTGEQKDPDPRRPCKEGATPPATSPDSGPN